MRKNNAGSIANRARSREPKWAPKRHPFDISSQASIQLHPSRDCARSWSAHGIDVEVLLTKVAEFDARIAASMRLMHTLALRRKESVMFRPYEHVQPFEQTGLTQDERTADDYLWTKGKGGRVRWVPIETAEQRAAVALARSLAPSRDAHMGDPAFTLKRNLGRLAYALRKFGITKKLAGTTGHGSRHSNFNDLFQDVTGVPSPVRGGGPVPPDLDRKARLIVASRAGHSRVKASSAYLGKPSQSPQAPAGASSGQRTRGAA